MELKEFEKKDIIFFVIFIIILVLGNWAAFYTPLDF